MNIEKLDSNNFNDTISNADKPIIVDFFADWCGPCKMIAPVLEEIASEHVDELLVYKVNVDEAPDIASKYSVMSVPTFLSFKGGQHFKTMVGAQSKQSILDLVKD